MFHRRFYLGNFVKVFETAFLQNSNECLTSAIADEFFGCVWPYCEVGVWRTNIHLFVCYFYSGFLYTFLLFLLFLVISCLCRRHQPYTDCSQLKKNEDPDFPPKLFDVLQLYVKNWPLSLNLSSDFFWAIDIVILSIKCKYNFDL